MASDIEARQQGEGFRRVHLAVHPARDELLFAQASRAFQPFAQIPQLLAAMAQKRQGLFPIHTRAQFHRFTAFLRDGDPSTPRLRRCAQDDTRERLRRCARDDTGEA